MSDETAYENDVLLGVPEPADLPAGVSYITPEEDREQSAFEEAHGKAVQALALTEERLRALRKVVKETYAEIKVLVAEEDMLRRMTRVRKSGKS